METFLDSLYDEVKEFHDQLTFIFSDSERLVLFDNLTIKYLAQFSEMFVDFVEDIEDEKCIYELVTVIFNLLELRLNMVKIDRG